MNSTLNPITGRIDFIGETSSSQGKEVLVLIGAKNGVNQEFTTNNPFLTGSSELHINGVKQLNNDDYVELSSNKIKLVYYFPDNIDKMEFIAIKI